MLLAYEGPALVACGGVCFYRVLPTCDSPSGKKAYIMNMYTTPAHRRRGLGGQVLAQLVARAREWGAGQIQLEATGTGRPLYAAHGFCPMQNEMELTGR